MTGPQPEPQVALSIPKDDLILPFQAEHAEVAGRLAKLDAACVALKSGALAHA